MSFRVIEVSDATTANTITLSEGFKVIEAGKIHLFQGEPGTAGNAENVVNFV